MNSILKVEQLAKTYDDGVTAVDHVSFEVHEGEVVGLVGPNGAGKTTTIHMILGLLEPSSGNIEIFGENIAKKREHILQKMNFAAPYAALPYNLTLFENLTVYSLLYGVERRKETIESLLREFKLDHLRNRRTGALSSGEQMRLALAKAFLNDPRFLLLDEPTSSLDPAIALDIRENIHKKMEKINGAVLWTSHNMREIEAMSDRVIFLLHGKIIANDTPDNLRKQFGKHDLEELFISLVRESEQEAHATKIGLNL
jgi:ABC-2 type transport system ATP-binding protein